MKIKLLMDVPVQAKHGMTQGSVHEVVQTAYEDDIPGVWVAGNGERVKILYREYETIKEEK